MPWSLVRVLDCEDVPCSFIHEQYIKRFTLPSIFSLLHFYQAHFNEEDKEVKECKEGRDTRQKKGTGPPYVS